MLQTAGLRPALRGPDTKQDKENAQSSDRLPLASKQLASSTGPLKPQAAPSRRPLGNITNKAGDKALGVASGDGKAAPSRRAFGDITNSQPFKAASDAKHVSVPQPGAKVALASKPRAAMRVAAADDSIERRAGKGWEQLEAERLQQEDNMIKQRVQMMTANLPLWPTPTLQSVTSSSRRLTNDADKDDMDLSPEPVIKPTSLASHWAARGGHSGLPARPVSPGTLELLTSPSPDCQSLSDLLMSSEEEDLLL